jgi:hypothetical protein
MTRNQVIRAWKDPEYRSRLSNAEREQFAGASCWD